MVLAAQEALVRELALWLATKDVRDSKPSFRAPAARNIVAKITPST
jgi:hypothetical protein